MNAVSQTEGTAITAAAAAKLSEYDFVIVLDASGSMGEPNKASNPTGPTRWAAAQESILSLAREIGKIDADGIDVVVFNGAGVKSFTGVTADKVKEVFANSRTTSTTPLDAALVEALKLAGKSDKKDFVIVLTDGVPDDRAAAAKVLVDASNSLSADNELTFLFIQVGDEPSATQYLQGLDDNLTGAKFDIVDVKTVAEVDQFPTVTDLILAAIDG
jgi:Mg-chelatase subunit ChlD